MSKLTELKAAFAKMGAEIEKLEAEPKGVWKPEKGIFYYFATGHEPVKSGTWYGDQLFLIRRANFYQSLQQAEKADGLMRQSNRIIQACINFDPYFLPDWMDAERKYSVGYYLNEKRWIVKSHKRMDSAVAYVSSEEIAQSICDLFNKEGEA